MSVEIEPGKTLCVSLQAALGDPEDDVRRLQFELNGQSRIVEVTARKAKSDAHGSASGKARLIADPANARHVASPMPGTVVAIAVVPGQAVRAGDVLASIEAMKMETHITAERDGEVESVHAQAGDQVRAKDLLIVVKAPMSN